MNLELLNQLLQNTAYNDGTETVDMTALNDTDALVKVRAYEKTVYHKITAGRASQFFGVNGIRKRLEDNLINTVTVQVPGMPIPTTIGDLCATVLDSANTTGFACDPATNDGAFNRAAAGLLVNRGIFSNVDEATDNLILGVFWSLGEEKTYPLQDCSMEQLKAVRYPSTLRDVTIADNDKIVLTDHTAFSSPSNTGGFRFTLTPAEDFTGSVRINAQAKKSTDTTYITFPQLPIVFSGEFKAGVPVSHTYQRVASLRDYRHFKFTFVEPYANAVTEVLAEGV